MLVPNGVRYRGVVLFYVPWSTLVDVYLALKCYTRDSGRCLGCMVMVYSRFANGKSREFVCRVTSCFGRNGGDRREW